MPVKMRLENWRYVPPFQLDGQRVNRCHHALSADQRTRERRDSANSEPMARGQSGFAASIAVSFRWSIECFRQGKKSNLQENRTSRFFRLRDRGNSKRLSIPDLSDRGVTNRTSRFFRVHFPEAGSEQSRAACF
jgi:hypothetical protein